MTQLEEASFTTHPHSATSCTLYAIQSPFHLLLTRTVKRYTNQKKTMVVVNFKLPRNACPDYVISTCLPFAHLTDPLLFGTLDTVQDTNLLLHVDEKANEANASRNRNRAGCNDEHEAGCRNIWHRKHQTNPQIIPINNLIVTLQFQGATFLASCCPALPCRESAPENENVAPGISHPKFLIFLLPHASSPSFIVQNHRPSNRAEFFFHLFANGLPADPGTPKNQPHKQNFVTDRWQTTGELTNKKYPCRNPRRTSQPTWESCTGVGKEAQSRLARVG
ncbi:hypothetical protein HYFRA_00011500 [Hymenoscyphus fraxineus]|uniref:Uncharacterized protein n=1 Tax=Hymenoscyphus fraxineus TaxID=746836 RepID=A0A9N9L3X7_9HELO|nr:hypothetical protein HYFRA_00011500 [Hymenoscyphus fraxineus]